ncbi:DUF5107 domain-containing protein [Paenibacillus sp. YN15]|uniref:tetratricopeptide repeat protein n=1 Tax=Paenibacillus sp. YN15 TaxID=1742774 RepID=UPI000DCB205B|nr:DUF5107 domain-containing protein [Paenibacillus sp. YN15]RAU99563.1 DUF5107 domain-containing protein [Paenibacillus sp. YN15]
MEQQKKRTGQEKAVRIWEETVYIPTYGTGEPDRNPMFLEKRIYQGSSGKVYPHPVIDRIEDNKEDRPYRLVYLENEYLLIAVMPELGGRIYRALDKTNNYDFVYYNRVIKPALVGLTGPWISGGIEFNWPQHHRPNTFGPVEYRLAANDDGSATVWCSEIDRMYGTKGEAGFTLYPGKAYLEIHGKLYNRTSLPQTFLWWANPAVAVNDHTQSVFPPDVHAVMDHGKRDVSRFPIADGIYYKMDYSAGVDISRYKNIPVPTSYMAYRSEHDFVGGYDHGKQAGILHIANHHISPGKKQWTWGNGDFGRAWDRNLTDEDGPYIELMTGVYTDNQPDFSWLAPYEEKTFKQYFMPYKEIGVVREANLDVAVSLELREAETGADVEAGAMVQVYATSRFPGACVTLTGEDGQVYLSERADLSPTETLRREVTLPEGVALSHVTVAVRTAEDELLLRYKPAPAAEEELPEPAKPIGAPEELETVEALYLAALHLEQYRHATREPEPYYLEGLRRAPADIRLNLGYGLLLLRRGEYAKAERYLRRAVETSTRHNPNPADGEALFHLGMALKRQGKLDGAWNAFYKAVWNAAWQDSGYFALAQIACRRGQGEEALELAERALLRNSRHFQARLVRTALLRKLGRLEEAAVSAAETLAADTADFGARHELALLETDAAGAAAAAEELRGFMRGEPHNYLALAADYADCGLWAEAILALRLYVPADGVSRYPMAHYALAWLYRQSGDPAAAAAELALAAAAPADYCFPNTPFEQEVLEAALAAAPEDARAAYYLGCLYYDRKRHMEAVACWERSRQADSAFPTVHRNLALAYYNKLGRRLEALASLEEAFRLNPADARVLFELDQLHKKLGTAPEERLKRLQDHMPLVRLRDDMYVELVTLLNLLGQHEEALELLSSRRFHPWEGGEGKAPGQYVLALLEIAKKRLGGGNAAEAKAALERALVYPENLGEGKLAGTMDNHIHYYLGLCHQALEQPGEAARQFGLASLGIAEPAGAMFYNDQPPEMIYYQGLALARLGRAEESAARFRRLVEYGQEHLADEVQIDYFAVSLPDFLVFDDDLDRRNLIHCRFMMGLGYLGLGYLGLGQPEAAAAELRQALELEPAHAARLFLPSGQ